MQFPIRLGMMLARVLPAVAVGHVRRLVTLALLIISCASTVCAQLPLAPPRLDPSRLDPTNPDSDVRRGFRQAEDWRIDAWEDTQGGRFTVTLRNPTDSLITYSINGKNQIGVLGGTQITYSGLGKAEIRFDRGLRDDSFFAYNLPSGNTYTFLWVKRDFPGAGTVRMLDLFSNVPDHDDSIHVRFTNATNGVVRIHLNGGRGIDADLDPGEATRFTMIVDDGVTPSVSIRQPGGGNLPFSVSDKGNYAFRREGSSIKNFYHEAEKVSFRYTINNAAGKEVRFRLPTGRDYTLRHGETESYTFNGDKAKAKLYVHSTGKGYQLREGNHKLWWMAEQRRVGLDLNAR